MTKTTPTKAARAYTLWLIATLKGGVRKTTTSMFLAFVLAARGYEVLVIDADTGTQGVTDWTSRAYANEEPPPFHVHQWSHRMGLLVPFIIEKQRETGATIVIVDVGGEAPEVLTQAVLLADKVLSPIGSEQGEISRIEATSSLIRPHKKWWRVLLTRVPVVGLGEAKGARASMVRDGYEVLDTEVPRNGELYGKVWGHVPEEFGAYESVADEMLKAA